MPGWRRARFFHDPQHASSMIPLYPEDTVTSAEDMSDNEEPKSGTLYFMAFTCCVLGIFRSGTTANRGFNKVVKELCDTGSAWIALYGST